MPPTNRRNFLGCVAAGAGGLVMAPARAETAMDGHAAGTEAVPFANGMSEVPRKPGEAPVFSVSLDRAPIKATSGGWAREVTSRTLPIATDIALAHLFLNPGGCREMHWHNSAEWAYVLGGRAQVTVVDPGGEVEVFNVEKGDLWYFDRGSPHAIQTIGTEPCHALLAFDDGLYSEHGTFGLTDWISRIDAAILAANFGVQASAFDRLPHGETYIMQGELLDADSVQARAESLLHPARTGRYRLLGSEPALLAEGGSMRVASMREFPASAAMTGLLLRLHPGALQEMHWHPDASEMHYVTTGRIRISMFGPDKHLAVAELGVGECGYVPRNAGHMVQCVGSEDAEVVNVQNAPLLSAATLSDWLARAPAHLLANNLRIDPGSKPPFRGRAGIVQTG